eukprot:scaffold4498_cov119-Isochrysis_galbana.AAC.34
MVNGRSALGRLRGSAPSRLRLEQNHVQAQAARAAAAATASAAARLRLLFPVPCVPCPPPVLACLSAVPVIFPLLLCCSCYTCHIFMPWRAPFLPVPSAPHPAC